MSNYRETSGRPIVEPAHMELADPDIELGIYLPRRKFLSHCLLKAFERCIEQGAKEIICHPFFLSRGRHVTTDIPEILERVGRKHPGWSWQVEERGFTYSYRYSMATHGTPRSTANDARCHREGCERCSRYFPSCPHCTIWDDGSLEQTNT